MLEDDSQQGIQDEIGYGEADALGKSMLYEQLLLGRCALDLYAIPLLHFVAILRLIGLLPCLFVDVVHPHGLVHVLFESHNFRRDCIQDLPVVQATDDLHHVQLAESGPNGRLGRSQ